MISYLPLAHMLERCCENGIYYSGAAVGFYTGNIRDLTSDLKTLRPTIMPAVPRLFNRVYDKLQNEISTSMLKRIVYNMALKSKESDLNRRISRTNTIWDKLVFRKIQECEYLFDKIKIFFESINRISFLVVKNIVFTCVLIGTTESLKILTKIRIDSEGIFGYFSR